MAGSFLRRIRNRLWVSSAIFLIFSEAVPEFSRGFGHVEGGIRRPILRRESRGDGQVMPVPDLAESDQKVGFGHPRAGKVDSDFMPQD